MQDSPTYQIHVGAVGWTPDDARGFYPDELPPEWRLAYYNNFFSCVYLPYEAWSGQDRATLTQWADDTLPRFRFVLQLDEERLGGGDAEKLDALDGRIGLLVVGSVPPEQLLWLEDFAGPQAVVAKARELVARGQQVFIISRAANFPAMSRVVDLLEAMRL